LNRRAQAALVLLVVVAYVPALGNGWIWDDDDYVTENRTLRSLEGLREIWFEIGAVPQYYPLVHTTFWIEYRLWGDRPFGYHAVNVALHAANALLAWTLLRRLGVPGAFWAAALFAVHPVHVESVAWVTERKNVLSTALDLSAFLAWLRFRPFDAESKGSSRFYAAALLLYLGALFSKTVTASLPAAILVVTWWKRGRLSRREVLPTLPMFAIGAGMGLLTVWMERAHVGAAGAHWDLSFFDRLLVASRAILFYLGKLVWPHPLAFVYERWDVEAAGWVWKAAPLVLLGAIALLFASRGRIGRGPLAAALLFGGTLFPALGFFDVYPMRFSFVADHFQYLASLSPIAAVAAFAASRLDARALSALGTAVVLALGVLSWKQCSIYENEEVLWRDTAEKVPSAFIAQNNLGGILLERGEVAEARRRFDAALAAEPEYAEAHVNLGLVAEREGRPDEAAARYRRALSIDPAFADAHNNLGIVLAQVGDLEGAIASFRRAVAHRKTFAKAHYNLGLALLRAGRAGEAVPPLERAVDLAPEDPDAKKALEQALREGGG
jgi:Tfp pilus assembly protein PilF